MTKTRSTVFCGPVLVVALVGHQAGAWNTTQHVPVSALTLVLTGSRERQGEAFPPSYSPPGIDEGGRGRNVAGGRRGRSCDLQITHGQNQIGLI